MLELRTLIIALCALPLFGCAQHHSIIESTTPCISPYQHYSFKLCAIYSAQIDNNVYTVPAGFITDLASIPKPLWILWAPHESAIMAPSILHDYFYSGKAKVSRKYADDVFYHHMVYYGVSRPRAWLFWSGVRLFGRWSFKEA